VKKIRLHLPKL